MIDYTIQPGDTFYSIARKFNVTPELLRAANPELVYINEIYSGRIIHIPYLQTVRDVINVNGFVTYSIDTQLLNERLPYLSWLSPLSYLALPDGTLVATDDEFLISAAKENGVASMMVISNLDENDTYSGELAHSILVNPGAQRNLLNTTLHYLEAKQYYGLILDFEYLYPPDYTAYTRFLQSISEMLRPLGYLVCVTIRLSTILQQRDLLNEAFRYVEYTRFINNFIVMNDICPPDLLEALDQMQQVLGRGTHLFPSQAILLGMPRCCYEAAAPQNDTPQPLTPEPAGAQMRSPAGDTAPPHMVCSTGAIDARPTLQLIDQYNLGGSSYLHIDLFPLESFQATAHAFDIRKPLSGQ